MSVQLVRVRAFWAEMAREMGEAGSPSMDTSFHPCGRRAASDSAIRTNAASHLTSCGFGLEVASAVAQCFGADAIRVRLDLLDHWPTREKVFEHANSNANLRCELCDAEV